MRILTAGFWIAALLLTSCVPRSRGVPSSQAPPATQTAGAAPDFNALVQKGDYAAAVRFVEKSELPANEKDGVIGILILDGQVDPSPATRPPYPLAEGFTRMERAAAAGRMQSAGDLRGKFTTGINYEGKNVLMPPNDALAKCWSGVEAGTGKAATCIALRRRLRIP